MKIKIDKQKLLKTAKSTAKAVAMASMMAAPQMAMAAINLPIVDTICDIASLIGGPMLGAIAFILIVAGGISIAASETTLFKWAGGALLGLSVAFGGVAMVSMFGGNASCIKSAI